MMTPSRIPTTTSSITTRPTPMKGTVESSVAAAAATTTIEEEKEEEANNNNNNNNKNNYNIATTTRTRTTRQIDQDNDKMNTHNTNTNTNIHTNSNKSNNNTRSKRIAYRLSRIEPSRGGGVCCTIQAALNAHLVLLGDYISSNNNNNRRNSRGYDNDDENSCSSSNENNSDDDEVLLLTEPLLRWLYYDEPETPVHPALEYETGHFYGTTTGSETSSVIQQHQQEQQQQQDGDMDDNSSTTSRSSSRSSNSIRSSSNSRIRRKPSISNYGKFIISLFCLVISGSSTMISAKFQSIPMYNYPIFLFLLHSLLAIPTTFILTYYFTITKSSSRRYSNATQQQQQQSRITDDTTNQPPPPPFSIRRSSEQIISSSAIGTTRTQKPLHLSRFVLVGIFDAISITIQVLSTNYLPGPFIVLIPPAAATIVLYILTLVPKHHRNYHPLLYVCYQYNNSNNSNNNTSTNNNNNHRSKQRQSKIIVSSVLVTIGLLFVIAGITTVLIPVITIKHAPEYYCEGTTMDDTTCLLCRQAITEEHCIQYNSSRNKQLPNASTTASTSITAIQRLLATNADTDEENDDETIVINSNDDNSNKCQWIPFEESSQEREWAMIVWSILLAFSTIPMVLSALFKQNLACRNKNVIHQNNTATTTTSAPTHPSEMITRIRTWSWSRYNRIMNWNNSIDNNNNNGNENNADNNVVPTPLLHPTLQSILDEPRYWNAWIAVLQFFVCIILVIPAWFLIRTTTNRTESISTLLEEILLGNNINDNASNDLLIPDDNTVNGYNHYHHQYHSNNTHDVTYTILSNIYDGWLCYSSGIDSVTTGCHPDTMCSELAFWSVNIHFITNCLYMTSVLFALKFLRSVSDEKKKSRTIQQQQQQSHGTAGMQETNESNEDDTNNNSFRIIMDEANQSDIHPARNESNNVNIPKGKDNSHRLLFLALIMTIPVADLMFLAVPKAWRSKLLMISEHLEQETPEDEGGGGSVAGITWEENITSLVCIVIGIVFMYVNRFQKSLRPHPSRRHLHHHHRVQESMNIDGNDHRSSGIHVVDPFDYDILDAADIVDPFADEIRPTQPYDKVSKRTFCQPPKKQYSRDGAFAFEDDPSSSTTTMSLTNSTVHTATSSRHSRQISAGTASTYESLLHSWQQELETEPSPIITRTTATPNSGSNNIRRVVLARCHSQSESIRSSSERHYRSITSLDHASLAVIKNVPDSHHVPSAANRGSRYLRQHTYEDNMQLLMMRLREDADEQSNPEVLPMILTGDV